MLQITIPESSKEIFVDETQEFVTIHEKAVTLQLEHSLISLSKWESKWHKRFYSDEEMTFEETLDYIRRMTLTPNVKPEVYLRLTKENVDAIMNYIHDPMTATTFADRNSPKKIGGEKVSAELIYYWMIALNIPFECQKWHLNRLITLIRVCEVKNTPPKKMNKSEIISRNAALNAARRKKLGTKG